MISFGGICSWKAEWNHDKMTKLLLCEGDNPFDWVVGKIKELMGNANHSVEYPESH